MLLGKRQDFEVSDWPAHYSSWKSKLIALISTNHSVQPARRQPHLKELFEIVFRTLKTGGLYALNVSRQKVQAKSYHQPSRRKQTSRDIPPEYITKASSICVAFAQHQEEFDQSSQRPIDNCYHYLSAEKKHRFTRIHHHGRLLLTGQLIIPTKIS